MRSKNEASQVFGVPLYALHKKDVWQEVWEKVELKNKEDFEFGSAFYDHKISVKRFNSGKVYLSPKTKSINVSRFMNWDTFHVPRDLEKIWAYGYRKDALREARVPSHIKRFVKTYVFDPDTKMMEIKEIDMGAHASEV